ncbi:MAG TPA: GYF domain-containing protein [Pyrinomonadaceae bacterium]|nr:GYF domain-containing protein [Pyrinomonadaceae bacterium]
MPIYVSKDGQQLGPYEDSIVIDQLRNGMLSPDLLGIRQGDASWSRLGELFPAAAHSYMAEPTGSARAFAGSPISASPSATAAVTSPQPEPQFRNTIAPKIFFTLCLLGVLGILASCVYYIFTFAPTGNLEADLGRMSFRDLAKYLAIGSFVGAFFTFLALLLSFKRKLIHSNGARLALRVFFVLALVVGIGNVLFGAISYLNYSAPTPTKSSQSNELLRALEAGSAATGPYETAMFAVPIGAGLFLFGLSGLLMTRRPRA